MAQFGTATAVTLGTYGPWFLPLPLRLSRQAAQAHFHVIGVAGAGKSRFLAGLYLDLLAAGLPATIIDPHGDLARLVLAQLVAQGYYARPDAYERLLYLDLPTAARRDRFLPLNVLGAQAPPHTIAANVLEALHRAWPALAAGQAPMFDALVLHGLKVLITNRLPLPALYRFLVEREFRELLLAREPDADVVALFRGFYDRLPLRDQLDQSGSTLRRIALLVFDPVRKYSLAQRELLLDFRALLDEGRSLIVNLAVPSGEARRLLGCLLTVSAEMGALSRLELPPDARRHSHHLLVDEFAEFSAQSEDALSRMLSQTRKAGLFVVMSHQTWSQTSERLRGALQNAGIEVVFKLGRQDAQYMAPLLARADPLQVKHEVADPSALERSHPLFYPLPEQWETAAQELETLKPREAVVRQPDGRTAQLRTRSVADPRVDAEALARVEEHYLQTCFRPQAEIEQELQQYRVQAAPSKAAHPAVSTPVATTPMPGAPPAYLRFLEPRDDD